MHNMMTTEEYKEARERLWKALGNFEPNKDDNGNLKEGDLYKVNRVSFEDETEPKVLLKKMLGKQPTSAQRNAVLNAILGKKGVIAGLEAKKSNVDSKFRKIQLALGTARAWTSGKDFINVMVAKPTNPNITEYQKKIRDYFKSLLKEYLKKATQRALNDNRRDLYRGDRILCCLLLLHYMTKDDNKIDAEIKYNPDILSENKEYFINQAEILRKQCDKGDLDSVKDYFNRPFMIKKMKYYDVVLPGGWDEKSSISDFGSINKRKNNYEQLSNQYYNIVHGVNTVSTSKDKLQITKFFVAANNIEWVPYWVFAERDNKILMEIEKVLFTVRQASSSGSKTPEGSSAALEPKTKFVNEREAEEARKKAEEEAKKKANDYIVTHIPTITIKSETVEELQEGFNSVMEKKEVLSIIELLQNIKNNFENPSNLDLLTKDKINNQGYHLTDDAYKALNEFCEEAKWLSKPDVGTYDFSKFFEELQKNLDKICKEDETESYEDKYDDKYDELLDYMQGQITFYITGDNLRGKSKEEVAKREKVRQRMLKYLVNDFDKGIFDILELNKEIFQKKLGFSINDEDYKILMGYSKNAKELYEKKKEEEEKKEKDGIEKAKKGLIDELTRLANENHDCRKEYAKELETIKKGEDVANVPILTKQLDIAISGIKYNKYDTLPFEETKNEDLKDICQKIEEVFQKAKTCQHYYNEKEIKKASEELIPKLQGIRERVYNRREEYEEEISKIAEDEEIEIIKDALRQLSTAILFDFDNVNFLGDFGVKLKEEGLEKELQERLCKEMKEVFDFVKSRLSKPQSPPQPQQQFQQQQGYNYGQQFGQLRPQQQFQPYQQQAYPAGQPQNPPQQNQRQQFQQQPPQQQYQPYQQPAYQAGGQVRYGQTQQPQANPAGQVGYGQQQRNQPQQFQQQNQPYQQQAYQAYPAGGQVRYGQTQQPQANPAGQVGYGQQQRNQPYQQQAYQANPAGQVGYGQRQPFQPQQGQQNQPYQQQQYKRY